MSLEVVTHKEAEYSENGYGQQEVLLVKEDIENLQRRRKLRFLWWRIYIYFKIRGKKGKVEWVKK